VAYLAALPDTVPSAANLSYYLDLVLEKYILRKMIHTCTEVWAGFTNTKARSTHCSTRWSATSCASAKRAWRAKTDKIKELVKKAISTIEDYHQRQGMLTGVGTALSIWTK